MKEPRPQKSRLEFQVVKSASSRDIALKVEKPSAWPWVQAAVAGALAIICGVLAFQSMSVEPTGDPENLEHLASAGANLALGGISAEQALLAGQCAVLAEDPRIKSTLGTEGIDAASIADILTDINKTAATHLSAILSQDGRVVASAGEAVVEGMDLRSSSIFTTAKAGHPSADSWIIGNRLFDVAGVPVLAGERPIAFLLLGRVFNESAVQDAARASRTAAMMWIGGKWASSPVAPEYQMAFDAAANLPNGAVRNIPNFSGWVSELGDAGHRAKFIFLAKRPIESNSSKQAAAWAPPIALLLFAMISLLSKLMNRN